MKQVWPPKLSETLGGLQPSMTLAITSKAKAMLAAGADVVAMSAGEPDFDTPQHIKDAAVRALAAGQTKYTPASGLPALREAVAEKMLRENGVPCEAQQVVVAPGAKFSVFSAIAVLCEPGDEVLLPTPCWLSYAEMVRAAGAVVVPVPTTAENGFCARPEDIAAQVSGRTKLLVLNTPSNPTGGVWPKAALEAVGRLAVEHGFAVLADEIYEKLVYDGLEHVSLASLGEDVREHTITVNGFSKAFAMTGWRLGYSVSPPWIASRIAALQSHTTSNATSFAQAGALAALQGPREPVETMRRAFESRRDRIYELLSGIPRLRVARPQGAFYIFPDIRDTGLDSMTFAQRALEEVGVAVIPGKPFGADTNIRLSYACGMEAIEKACARLAQFCAGL
ncbi:MAG: pyridoxal phosphate-dependent aminotransferase [Kiritimatiellaeota bacterium]|nr:pyridoxal phosphate-dependent aminotransferase [Kiritimatiellota bacterium]